eukprot:TRINITY_DN391_c0_g1_i1.p1 TRINITY_DN391_c0_g1~~TRINITY_DN391_c0_g1_i1.p1  ORF type:complete len:445 (+),score=128.41 TRINITY_DN391_c0_g1_i1:100-1434(+)
MRNLIELLNDDNSDEENEENEGEEGDNPNQRRRVPINMIFMHLFNRMHERDNSSHEELLKNLLKYEKDLSLGSREYLAFKEIRRDFFVPEKYKRKAFNDSPLDIDELKTNLSSPHIYPKCLLLLDLDHTKNQSILDIGSGTGWFTALASHVGGENCTVEGWDLSEEIIEEANKNLKNLKEDVAKRIKYSVRNAFWPSYSSTSKKFDRINVGASIPVEERMQLYNLLKPNGKLVSPIAEGLFVVENDPEKGFVEKSHLDVRYRMLILPEKIPIWIPKLSVHSKYPPVIREQITCLVNIYFLRESFLSFLPLEIIYQILSFLYRNPSNTYTSSYLNFLKQNEIQFRRKHNLERDEEYPYLRRRHLRQMQNEEENDDDDDDLEDDENLLDEDYNGNDVEDDQNLLDEENELEDDNDFNDHNNEGNDFEYEPIPVDEGEEIMMDESDE